jgi:hypothetical protein
MQPTMPPQLNGLWEGLAIILEICIADNGLTAFLSDV